MRTTSWLAVVFALVHLIPVCVQAEIGIAGGRGGPFIEYHSNNLTRFDPDISGNPIIIGGAGFGFAAKNYRIGGGGGGGFLWNPKENTMFGLGYGGAIVEYGATPWLTGRILIGGGGFAISKVISETETIRVLQKVSSGAFVVFYPSICIEMSISGWVKLGINAGYFMPNISKLQSFTTGVVLLFGKV